MNVIAMELFDLFWSMLWFFLFIMWIYMFITLFADIFRSRDLGGWGKALWSVLLIVVPIFGALIYIVARGSGMAERQMEEAQRAQDAFRSYVQEAAATAPTTADEVAKLVVLHDRGVLDDQEFERQKARVLA